MNEGLGSEVGGEGEQTYASRMSISLALDLSPRMFRVSTSQNAGHVPTIPGSYTDDKQTNK